MSYVCLCRFYMTLPAYLGGDLLNIGNNALVLIGIGLDKLCEGLWCHKV